MKQLLEFIPLILFFTTYQMNGQTVSIADWSHTVDGIFSATAVLMISSLLVWALVSLVAKANDRRLMWMTIAVVVFGAATLLLRDQRFIQWKPTVFNWTLAAVFIASQFLGEKNLLQRMLGQQIALPAKTWKQLNGLWVTNFAVVGALNLFVAYRYEEAFWVSYKLYSSIGFTVLLMLLTVALVAPQLQPENDDPANREPLRRSP